MPDHYHSSAFALIEQWICSHLRRAFHMLALLLRHPGEWVALTAVAEHLPGASNHHDRKHCQPRDAHDLQLELPDS